MTECPERIRLRNKYQVAVSDYSRAVKVLAERTGVMSLEDYDRVRDFCEKSRVKYEEARAAMDWHINDHDC